MAAKKTQSQMWQEFGAWLRAEDVAAWAGKATGAKEAVAKTSAKRASDLIAKYGPKKKTDGSEGPKTPTKKVDGGRGTNPGNPGSKMGTKPPVRTSPTVRPGRLAPEDGIKQGRYPVGQQPYVKVGRQKPPSISGEGRRYAPRKTNDAIPNSLKRKTK